MLVAMGLEKLAEYVLSGELCTPRLSDVPSDNAVFEFEIENVPWNQQI